MKKTILPLLYPILLVPQVVHAADSQTPNSLPLREVALFSSGVGYFGRAGQVDGDATIPLTVHAPQIADLLKSLVLFDPRGTVRPVSYSLQDWMNSRPRDTDLNINAAATPGALLQGFQGALVHLDKPEGAIEGRILSVSSRSVKTGDTITNIEQVTLLTATGVQSVRLDDLSSFRLLDPALDAKLRATLEKRASALTQHLDDGARSLNLHFEGKGKRDVRAGYLLETPAWKTSYRLVLDAKQKPYLQGWAIVENTTDEDWNSVHLSLISGRPISFVQDLATPIYISRPVVPPQTIGSPTPQTFGEGYSTNQPGDADDAVKARLDSLEARPVPGIAAGGSAFGNSARSESATEARIGGRLTFSPAPPANRPISAVEMAQQAQAQGTTKGALFEYAIDGATTIASGQAAMVPIISADIGGDAVTIVPSSLDKGEIQASNGFALRNSSGLYMQGGPITVYSAGIYAGDSLISNLSPNDSRLISYAVDLDLIANQDAPESNSNIIKLTVVDGVLQIKSSAEVNRTWTFKNKSTAPKSVLLQVPDQDGWKLADPKQLDEKTSDAQRFKIVAKPGQTTFKVKWVQQTQDTVALFDAGTEDIGAYITEKAISPALKAKLTDIIAQKTHLNDLAAQRALQEAAVKDIDSDQARIRANMIPLDKNGVLFKNYETKLGAQENKIEKARTEIARLRDAENTARIALKASVNGLNSD